MKRAWPFHVVIAAGLLALPASVSAQLADRVLLVDRPGATLTMYTHPVTSNIFFARQSPTGASPESVAVSPNGRLAFIANLNSAYISVVDLTINAEITRLRPYLARTLAVSPDGTRLLAALQGGANTEKIAVFDTGDFSLIGTVDTNGLLGDTAARNSFVGGFAFYGNDDAYFTTVRGATGRLNYRTLTLTNVPGTFFGNSPLSSSIVITPDQSTVFVASWNGSRIFAINPATATVVNQINIPNWLLWAIAVGPAPLDNTKTHLYVLATPFGAPGSSLKVFDASGAPGSTPQWGTQIKPDAGTFLNFDVTTSVLSNGADMALSSDGKTLYLGQAFFLTATDNAGQLNVLPNVIDGLDRSARLGEFVSSLTVAKTLLFPPPTAPVITRFEPDKIENDTFNYLKIQGSGFSADAQVRIGNLDPITPFFNTPNELQIFLLQGIPSQSAQIVVTNRNAGMPPSDQWMSGITPLSTPLTIASSHTFQPKHQVGVANFGDETGSLLNYSTSAGVVTSPKFLHNPLAVAMSGDGVRAYVLSQAPVELFVWNFVTMTKEARISVTNNAPGVFESLAWTPTNPFTPTRGPAVFLVGATFRTGLGLFDNNLFVLDADPASPSYNTLTNFPGNLDRDAFAPGGLAATANGEYVFTLEGPLAAGFPAGRLLLWNVASGNAMVCGIDLPSLGMLAKPWALRLVNGRYLLTTNSSGKLVLMQVVPDGSDPATTPPSCPGSGQILNVTLPPNGPYNLRVVNSALYIFSGFDNVVEVRNFDPAGNDFTLLGSYTITGTVGADPALEVTPDGMFIYAGQSESDAVVVLDTAAVIANDTANAQVTSFRTGINPLAIAFRPGVATPPGTDVTVTPGPGVYIKFPSIAAPGGETSITTVNSPIVPAPEGFRLGSTPIYYDVVTTAPNTWPVVLCFPVMPGIPTPQQLLHFDDVLGWVNVTVPNPPDVPATSVCGQVNSFSPFVVGWGTPDFQFASLISEVTNSVTHEGIMKSLRAKLLAARASYERGQPTTAYNQLRAFEEEVSAQSGKNLDASTVSNLLAHAATLLGQL